MGAGNGSALFPDELPVCAIAAGPIVNIRHVAVTNSFRIRFFHVRRTASNFPGTRGKWLQTRRVEMNVTAIIDDTIAGFVGLFTICGKRFFDGKIVRAGGGLAVAAGNIDHEVRLA